MNPLMRQSIFICSVTYIAAFLLFVSVPAYADKTDIVYLKNGDIITGEIRGLQQGEFKLRTNTMGTIKIKWAYVDSIVSTKLIQIELTDGSRYLGSLNKGASDRTIVVDGASGRDALDLNEVVFVQTVNRDESLWQALDKYLQLGFNFTKATDIAQWNVAAGAMLKEENFQLSLDANSMVTNNGRGEDSTRADISTTYLGFLQNRWFWFATGGLEKNDELGIDNRLLAGGGIGRFIWQTNASELLLGAGLTVNREEPLGIMGQAAEVTLDAEGLFYLEWTHFRASFPRSRLNAVLHVYPSLGNNSRYRANLDLRYRQELVEDMYFNITWYNSYDSAPPQSALAKEDYGIITALEYHW